MIYILFWSLHQAIIFPKKNIVWSLHIFCQNHTFLFWILLNTWSFFNSIFLYHYNDPWEDSIFNTDFLDLFLHILCDDLQIIALLLKLINKFIREEFTFIKVLIYNEIKYSFHFFSVIYFAIFLPFTKFLFFSDRSKFLSITWTLTVISCCWFFHPLFIIIGI